MNIYFVATTQLVLAKSRYFDALDALHDGHDGVTQAEVDDLSAEYMTAIEWVRDLQCSAHVTAWSEHSIPF